MLVNLGKAQVVFILGEAFPSGGPCAGKGFLCSKAAEEMKDIDHICMGDILRAERNTPGSKWAEEIEYHMREGGLVPSELSMKLLRSHISKAMGGERKKFILDGFPRKIDQAILFEKEIGSCKAALFLQCPKEIMIERLLQRSKTSGRIDDNVVVFEKRYEGYLKDSLPVVEHLKNVNVRLIEISSAENGEQGWIKFKDALMDGLANGRYQSEDKDLADIKGRKWH